jgi:hypothetical protein
MRRAGNIWFWGKIWRPPPLPLIGACHPDRSESGAEGSPYVSLELVPGDPSMRSLSLPYSG